MFIIRFIVIIMNCVALPAYAHAADLEPYVGKYPHDKVKGRTIYEIADVKRNFIKKFGSRYWMTLLDYGVSSPIEAVTDANLGRVVLTSQCMRHNCPTHAVVILKPSGEALAACFTEEEKTIKTVWMAPGWRKELTGEPCQEPGETNALKIIARLKSLSVR